MQVMPRFGLSDVDLKSVIDSACKEPTKGSRLIDQIIGDLSATLEVTEGGTLEMTEDAEDGLDYSGKVFLSDSDIELGDEVAKLIEATFPKMNGKVERFDIGCTIGSHTGPGTVALFFRGKKREN